MNEEEFERLEDEFHRIVHSVAYDTALGDDFYTELEDGLTAFVDKNGVGKSEELLNRLRKKYGRSPLEQALDDAIVLEGDL